jgi:cell division protein FtsI/penicillin-binding protein 2
MSPSLKKTRQNVKSSKIDYSNLANSKNKSSFLSKIQLKLKSWQASKKIKENQAKFSQKRNSHFTNKNVESEKNDVKEKHNLLLKIQKNLLNLFKNLVLITIEKISNFSTNINRGLFVRVVFVIFFLVIGLRLAQLQLVSNALSNSANNSNWLSNLQIIPARRGQIFIQDLSQSKNEIPVTSSQSLANVYFDPLILKNQLDNKVITIDEASKLVSGALNIDWKTVENMFKTEVAKPNLLRHVVIQKFIDSSQKQAIDYLRSSELYTQSGVASFSPWLGVENIESRVYPENQMLSSTIGFAPRNPVTAEEALKVNGCQNMVLDNQARGTSYLGQYNIGYYGLEQKYCSVLAGLNGRQILSREIGSNQEEQARVINGANIYTTIDRNLQRQAEETLNQLVKDNTNSKGGPKDGSILIMETKTGRILAMASYPTFDPNRYEEATVSAFRNSLTSIDYEVGSVMKPLTVAAVRNEWDNGAKDSNGKNIGVPSDWSFEDYDSKGKPYQERNGTIYYIRNSQNFSYRGRGKQDLSNVLRDSINTGIAQMLSEGMPNSKLQQYITEQFRIGQPTQISLPGDGGGDVRQLSTNLNSGFTYATFGFGQGFTQSPIQLARAYTALANNGKIVEPYLVDKIVYGDNTVDNGTSENSIIKRKQPQQVISEKVAKEVTGYLVNVIDQGYLGQKASKGQVSGYSIAGKTGTSQVGRIDNAKLCALNENIYDCNTRLGVYDHTFIGYGPSSDPQILVLIKLSEPSPGNVNNFAETTLGASFSKTIKNALEYLGVPKTR